MAKKEIMKATFVGILKVEDPDDGNEVSLEIWKDPCGGIFAIDSSFLEQDSDKIPSPFNPTKVILDLSDEPLGNGWIPSGMAKRLRRGN